MRATSPSFALLWHVLLLLSSILQLSAPANPLLQSARASPSENENNGGAAPPRIPPRDSRTRRATATTGAAELAASRPQERTRRILQGGDDAAAAGDDAAAAAAGGDDAAAGGDDDDGSANVGGDDEDCRGSKFQIVIRFDAYPEDFAMRLRNDVNNKTVWAFNDPDHNYTDAKFRQATVSAGVCLPKDWCWMLTVSDRNGDGMVGNDLSTPGNGGGFRLLFNGLTVNYYTGKYNGCYQTMWFRFGEWCSAQEQFAYAPGDESAAGCGNFTVGRAPDDGWFDGNLYGVGPPTPTVPHTAAPTPAPVPVPTAAPMAPTTAAPIRVGPTDRPVLTEAPVRATYRPVRTAPPAARADEPTDRPQTSSSAPTPTASPTDVPTSSPTAEPTVEPTTVELSPTADPTSASSSPPTDVPSAAAVVTAAPQPQPQQSQPSSSPVFCHFRYCRRNNLRR